MARNDVAIYAPYASQLYEGDAAVSGGAELQTVMLAESLAAQGVRCAHIVLPVRSPRADLVPGLELVQRGEFAGGRGPLGKVQEVRRVWRALGRADAHVYVVRGGWPALGVAAAFCARHRRRLVFAATSDRNFASLGRGLKQVDYAIYRAGAQRSDAIVAQTEDQRRLAARVFPRARRTVAIASFAEPAERSRLTPEAFLWTGRLIGYKNPMAYVELARAVPEARFWMIPKFADEDPGPGREVQAAAGELPNLELLDSRPRPALMDLVERTVAIVNTSPLEGMPNLFLEGWARGVPALTLDFDPGGLIAARGLGRAAAGSSQRFAEGARELWEGRMSRDELSERVCAYVAESHSPAAVGARWRELIEELR